MKKSDSKGDENPPEEGNVVGDGDGITETETMGEEDAINEDPNIYTDVPLETRLEIGVASMQEGNLEDAVSVLAYALEDKVGDGEGIRPDVAEYFFHYSVALLELAKAESDSLAGRIPAEDEIDNMELAWENIEAARLCYELLPDSNEKNLKLLEVHYKSAEILEEESAFESCLEEYTLCLKYADLVDIPPKMRADLHSQLGRLYCYFKQFEKAQEAIGKAREVIEARQKEISPKVPEFKGNQHVLELIKDMAVETETLRKEEIEKGQKGENGDEKSEKVEGEEDNKSKMDAIANIMHGENPLSTDILLKRTVKGFKKRSVPSAEAVNVLPTRKKKTKE